MADYLDFFEQRSLWSLNALHKHEHAAPEGGWSEGTRLCVLGRVIPSLRVFDRGEFDHLEVNRW